MTTLPRNGHSFRFKIGEVVIVNNDAIAVVESRYRRYNNRWLVLKSESGEMGYALERDCQRAVRAEAILGADYFE